MCVVLLCVSHGVHFPQNNTEKVITYSLSTLTDASGRHYDIEDRLEISLAKSMIGLQYPLVYVQVRVPGWCARRFQVTVDVGCACENHRTTTTSHLSLSARKTAVDPTTTPFSTVSAPVTFRTVAPILF